MALTKKTSLREAIAHEEARLLILHTNIMRAGNDWQRSRQSSPPWNQPWLFLPPRQYNLALIYLPPRKEKSRYFANYSVAGMMSYQSSG